MHGVKKIVTSKEETELRRGPWTLEEDTLLIHYIARHGEGHWNLLAKHAGLKRTGKSCRLRWLNYLKPDIKRGNLTPQEQLLILELHSKLGNRWSKIAQHLPGRTDNEIKNYWRTRVQKQARQLNIKSNSKRFVDAVRCFWMPRLLQKVEQSSSSSSNSMLFPEMSSLNIPIFSDSSRPSIDPQIKHSLPISDRPNGCPNNNNDSSFTNHTAFDLSYHNTTMVDSFEPRVEEEPIKPYYAVFDSSCNTNYYNNNNNNNAVINPIDQVQLLHQGEFENYADALTGGGYGFEGLTLDPVSLAEPGFGVPGLDCHVAVGDWAGDASLWDVWEM